MLTLLIGIFFGLAFLWVLFFAGKVDSSALAGEENEEANGEPYDYEYEPRQETSLSVWNWNEEDEQDEDDDDEEDDDD